MALSLNANWLEEFGKGRVPIRFRVSVILEDDSGSITAIANNGSGKARMTSAGHTIEVGEYVRIEDTGTSYYDTQSAEVTAIAASTFDTDQAYVGGSPGLPGTWRSRRTHSFLSGKCTQIAEPESVVSVEPISRAMDPVLRSVQVSQSIITMNRDLLIESLIETYGLQGRSVKIEIGTEALSSANFEDFGGGTIEDVDVREKHVVLTIKSAETRLQDREITMWPYNKHPITVMGDIAGDESYHDSTTFDWDADTTTSHYVVSRVGVRDFYEDRAIVDMNGAQLLSGLCQIVPGVVVANEEAKLHFRKFDASSVDDHWTADEYRNFRPLSLYRLWANKLTVKTHEINSSFRDWYTLDDVASQKRHAFILESATWADRIKELVLDAEWLSAFSFLDDAITSTVPAGESSPGAADGDTFAVSAGEVWSFCGTQWPTSPGWPGGSQDADAQLTSSRTAYLRVDDEVIEIDQITPVSTNSGIVQLRAGLFSTWSTVELPGAAICRCKNRGALSTTAAAHVQFQKIKDITIGVDAAAHYIDRMTNGLWMVECRTSLAKFGTQIGDIITLDNDNFLAYGVNGLDSNTKFEVVGKKPEGFGDIPSILWTLAYAGETSPPTQELEHGLSADRNRDMLQQMRTQGSSANVAKAKVISGFGFTDAGGLSGHTLATGVACYGIGETGLDVDVTVNLTASKDTYLGFDTQHDQALRYETSLGGSAPDWEPWIARLWKLVTDGSGITTQTDLRSGEQFVDDVVTTNSIDDLAVTTPKLEAGSVTTAKIAAANITTALVASNAIFAYHSATDSDRRNHNFDFGYWGRG